VLTDALNAISKAKIASKSAIPFVQQIAKQAVVLDDGILERELSYSSGSTRGFLDALFGSAFILSSYRPVGFDLYEDESAQHRVFVNRIARVFERAWTADQANPEPQAVRMITMLHPSVIEKMQWPSGYGVPPIVESAGRMVQATVKYVDKLADADKASLLKDGELFEENIAQACNLLVSDVLRIVHRRADEGKSDGGMYTILGQLFPSGKNAGLPYNAVHVHVVRGIVRAVRSSLSGGPTQWDFLLPSLLRFVGHRGAKGVPTNSPFKLLEDCVYSLLSALPEIQSRNDGTLERLLPETFKYDAANDRLLHVGYNAKTTSMLVEEFRNIVMPEIIVNTPK
jgi:hypothetical protein